MDLKIDGKLEGVQKILIESENSVKLTRGQKGNYGWEIKVSNISNANILDQLRLIDNTLKERYGGVDDGNATNADVA